MYIAEYDINPEMANDIRDRALLAQGKDSEISKELIIYTPKFSNMVDVHDSLISPLRLAPQSTTILDI